jgi:hypothetical protein
MKEYFGGEYRDYRSYHIRNPLSGLSPLELFQDAGTVVISSIVLGAISAIPVENNLEYMCYGFGILASGHYIINRLKYNLGCNYTEDNQRCKRGIAISLMGLLGTSTVITCLREDPSLNDYLQDVLHSSYSFLKASLIAGLSSMFLLRQSKRGDDGDDGGDSSYEDNPSPMDSFEEEPDLGDIYQNMPYDIPPAIRKRMNLIPPRKSRSPRYPR